MIRLFIALPVEKDVESKLNLIIDDLKSYGGRVKYVKPENIHLTLKFLGNTEAKRIESVKKEIDQVAYQHTPINSSITEIGSFPNWNKPRVIWAGLEDNQKKIIQLSQKIELAMKNIGWDEIDKKFNAHLTLGRVKDSIGLENLRQAAQSYSFEPILLTFDRITLFQSKLTQKGPIYKILHEAKLAERFG